MGAVRHGLAVTAATLLSAATAFAQSTTLTLGTASIGGTYYVYGETAAKVLTEKTRYQVVAQQNVAGLWLRF